MNASGSARQIEQRKHISALNAQFSFSNAHFLLLNHCVGKYVWLTYQKAYELSIQIGSAVRSYDVRSGSFG
ncbi:hypothetical protein SUGI_1140000 [Cryptomeria japonica]|nr:hypothetical protein SUGI_1140000 [Cryptomeria japonica]